MSWPCDTARLELAQLYGPDRVALSELMVDLLFIATAQAPRAPATEMHQRFVAWTL